MKGISNTKTENLAAILVKPGMTYVVPQFQRDYSWDKEQWEELWLDIEDLAKNKEHYMGYLVLQPNGDPQRVWVIDGQQRLTTLSILIISVLRCLQEIEEKTLEIDKKDEIIKKRKNIHDNYIGGFYFLSKEDKQRLVLNRHLESYYANSIVDTLGRNAPTHGRLPGEKLLKQCCEFFYGKLKNEPEESLIELINTVSRRLFFTVIEVSDEINAYQLFETLNARGLSLSPADLLKNYLFQTVKNSNLDIELLEKKWDHVVSLLGEEVFSEFLYAYWNSAYSEYTRKNNLYRSLRNKITSGADVIDFLDKLKTSAPLYQALHDASNEYWDEPLWSENPQLRDIPTLLNILKIFGVKQIFSLLLAGLQYLPPDKFRTLLRDCVVISFRYNKICNKNPNEQETIYHNLAVLISQERKYNRLLLKSIYPEDEVFMQAFKNKSLVKEKNLIKYILLALNDDNIAVSQEDKFITLEHILPQNPNESWPDISRQNLAEHINRLGNLTLLEKSLHKDLPTFIDKKNAYEKSRFQLTKKTSEHDTWNESTIRSRQEEMAKKANALWRLEFQDH
jgi:hypothetical protein